MLKKRRLAICTPGFFSIRGMHKTQSEPESDDDVRGSLDYVVCFCDPRFARASPWVSGGYGGTGRSGCDEIEMNLKTKYNRINGR